MADRSLAVTLTVAELQALVRDEITHALDEHEPQTPSPILTRAEAARYLRCSLTTLDKLCREQSLPFHLLADSRRFDQDELRAWLLNNK